MESTGYILAAAGIAVANEILFLPAVEHKTPQWSDFNWRVIPATAIAALTIGGIEKVSPTLGKGLAILALMAILITPIGKAGSPVENAAKFIGV
jgi:hypothetical protein